MAVNIEHEDQELDQIEGLRSAAETLLRRRPLVAPIREIVSRSAAAIAAAQGLRTRAGGRAADDQMRWHDSVAGLTSRSFGPADRPLES